MHNGYKNENATTVNQGVLGSSPRGGANIFSTCSVCCRWFFYAFL